MDEVIVCELPPCPQVVPPADDALEAPDTIDCEVPVPDPGEVPPDAGRLEVVLVDAEPALLVLGAVDGSLDGYLVPAYRFTDADGGTVALPAVANSALTTPPTPATEPVPPPPPDTVIEPQPCDEPIVEADASGTTITVQPDPCVLPEPATLADGEEPVVGVGYYVDVDTTCHEGSFELAGQIWNIDGGSTDGWSTPHEGGMFTLDAVDHGTFVGDADAATKTATFRPRAPEADYICVPAPRS